MSAQRALGHNRLVQSKNGSVIREHFGYSHISQPFANPFNTFCKLHLIPYRNFHRPRLFPTIEIDAKGKAIKHYRYAQMMTPYKGFKSLPNAAQSRKCGVRLAQLDRMLIAMIDNEAASLFTSQRNKIFSQI